MNFVELQTKIFIRRIQECIDHALHANSIMDLFHVANEAPVPLCTINEAETRPLWVEFDHAVERRGRELIAHDLKAIETAFHCGDLERAGHLINVLRHGLRYLGGYAPMIYRYGNHAVAELTGRLQAKKAAQNTHGEEVENAGRAYS